MAGTPTFGRYAEIPYDQMTPEQQEGYRSLIETRGRLPGPNRIYVHNPKLAKGLYERAVDALGHVGVTDVITLMGFYTSVAMTLAFYDVPAGATGMER